MISIVEDDASVRDATWALVRSLGYDARAFGSAEEFLDSGEASESRCVISDVRLGGLDGLELQQRLAASGRSIPLIFVTAFPDERIRHRAMDAGAVGFLTKPFQDEDLLDCLRKAGLGQ